MCGFATVPPIPFLLLYFSTVSPMWNQNSGMDKLMAMDGKMRYINFVCRENGWEHPYHAHQSSVSLLSLPFYFHIWSPMEFESHALILWTNVGNRGYGMKSALWRTTLRFPPYQMIEKEAQHVVLPFSCFLLWYGNMIQGLFQDQRGFVQILNGGNLVDILTKYHPKNRENARLPI